MKKIALFALILAGGIYSFGQPVGGNIFIGGDFSFYGTGDNTKSDGATLDNGKNIYISFLPMVGYHLSEKITVGARLGIDVNIFKEDGSDPDRIVNSLFVINPFGRYYIISGQGGLFAEASVYTGIGTNKTYYQNGTIKENRFDFSMTLSPGVYYYITERLALEAKFGWFGFETDMTKDENDVKNTTNYFGFHIAPDSFTFGVTFTL